MTNKILQTYDTFLFDADNTLFDYDAAEKVALQATLSRHNYPFTQETHNHYRRINTEAWASFHRGEITKPQMAANRFSQLFSQMDVQGDGEIFNQQYLEALGTASILMDGALELCKHLTETNKKIYIITNGIRLTNDARIKHSTLTPYISAFFVSEVVGYEKPHTAFFQHVFDNISPTPKEKILVIGDSLTADIAGGLAAGVDTCWFNIFQEENHSGFIPTYEIHNLKELLP